MSARRSLDAKRMIMSVRRAESLLLEPAVRQCFEEIYLMPRQAPLKLINGTGLAGVFKAAGATAVLMAPTPLRRAVIDAAIKPERVASDDAIKPISDDEILAATGASFHPSSTCAIGAESGRWRWSSILMPRVSCRGIALRRRLGDAENCQRQHQHTDHHDCRAGRRVHAQSELTLPAARP
jgi:hypothetical protein